MNFDTESSHVLLLKFTSQVSLDKGGLNRVEILVSLLLPGRFRVRWWGMLNPADNIRITAWIQVSTHLAGTTITNKHQLEGWRLGSRHFGCDGDNCEEKSNQAGSY